MIRRCRAVTKLGPGSLQSWAGDVIEILREAHQATAEARARGEPAADAELLAKLRQRYDEAVAFGITHNRHRDWHDGNHPGYTLSCWLRDYADQVLAVHPPARRRLDERSGFTLHLLGVLRSIGVGVVVTVSWCSYCRVCF